MSYIRRHIMVVFFFLTYLFSWGAWLWVDGTRRELSGWIGLVALLGAFGPSLAGLVCTERGTGAPEAPGRLAGPLDRLLGCVSRPAFAGAGAYRAEHVSGRTGASLAGTAPAVRALADCALHAADRRPDRRAGLARIRPAPTTRPWKKTG